MRLGWLGTFVRTQHDDFDDVEGRGAIPILHDQDITVTEARLAVDVGLTKRFGASLVLPVRVVSTRIRYLDGDLDQVNLVTPSTHHRNETLSGIADPMILGAVLIAPITLRAGITVPLGRTEHDPFAMPEMAHQHIQMGSGTVNPVVAVEGGYSWDKWRLSGFGFTQQTFYENSKGYQAGDRYAAAVSVRRLMGTKATARVGLELNAETYERWGGVRYTDEGNQGRIDAMFAFGGTYKVTDAMTIDFAVKAPFVTHVVGGQLDMPALLEVGASYAFGKPRAKKEEDEHEHEHEHDHAHEDEHEDEHEHEGHEDEHAHEGHEHEAHALDTTGVDVADLGKAGARVELVPVPGKITIFDFWAEWCEPCKTLEPVLVEIAKANPKVAVRRIDAVDWESEVVAQHLTPGGWNLPHIKIYDANAKLVYEDSSGPGKLPSMIEAIREKTGAAKPAPVATVTDIDIVVTERGFEPADIAVPRGTPVTLRFQRKTKKTCATELNFVNAGEKVRRELPLDQRIELKVTFKQPGVVKYTCDMDMIGGTITVR